MLGLKLITAPTEEPLDVDELARHCRIDDDERAADPEIDLDLEAWAKEAREEAEDYTGRALFEQVWELVNDEAFGWDGYLPYGIFLPKPPLIEVVSYRYLDTDGNEQILAADQYTVDMSYPPRARIVPAYGVTWPAVRTFPGAVKIRFKAGYARVGSPSELSLIPRVYVNAIRAFVSFRNENREVVDVPPGFHAALRKLRVEGLG